MKKILYSLAIVGLSLNTVSLSAQQPSNKPVKEMSKEEKKAESDALMSRLKEIEKMDKSQLSPEEKKDLKKEIRTIEKRLHILSGGLLVTLIGIAVVVGLLLIMF